MGRDEGSTESNEDDRSAHFDVCEGEGGLEKRGEVIRYGRGVDEREGTME